MSSRGEIKRAKEKKAADTIREIADLHFGDLPTSPLRREEHTGSLYTSDPRIINAGLVPTDPMHEGLTKEELRHMKYELGEYGAAGEIINQMSKRAEQGLSKRGKPGAGRVVRGGGFLGRVVAALAALQIYQAEKKASEMDVEDSR